MNGAVAPARVRLRAPLLPYGILSRCIHVFYQREKPGRPAPGFSGQKCDEPTPKIPMIPMMIRYNATM